MRVQTLFHLAVLGAMAALGVWIVRLELDPEQVHRLGEWSGIAAALYWFTALSFALVSSLWLVAGRRRGWLYLFSGYLLSLAIAVSTAWIVLQAGRQAARSTDDPHRIQLPPASR